MTGSYAHVNRLQMYYEVHGTGRPLVLLHGGVSTIDVDFGAILPRLAADRQVIAVEQQAHGHTADIDRPLSHEAMAGDTVALLRHLRVEKADFFGYSMGGGIATQVAIRHPDMVRKLVFAGGVTHRPDGFHPEITSGMKQMRAEQLAGTPFHEAYLRAAPDPEQWPALIAKITELSGSWKGFSPEDVRSIEVPTLVVIGDADIVPPESTVEMFRLLGGGVAGDLVGLPRARLAVLPGTTHITLVHRADWLVSMVTEFLDEPMEGRH